MPALIERAFLAPGTEPATAASSRAVVLALGLLTLLAALLRLFRLGRESLWTDEAFSWWWSHQSVAALWGANAALEPTPPLYYTLQHWWLAFGDSEAALRAPAMLAGVAAVPLVFLIGRLIAGNAAGLLAAALVAVSRAHVFYSQEARAYTLLSALGLAAVLGLLLFLRRASPAGEVDRGGLALYAAATAAALYTHNTALFLPALANLAVLAWWLAAPGPRRAAYGWWLAANLVPLLAWLWWLPVVAAQERNGVGIAWIAEPGLRGALRVELGLYGLRAVARWQPTLENALHGLLLALVAVWLWRARPPLAWVPALLALGVPALTYLVGLVAQPIWIERTVFWPEPLGLVLVAAAVAALRPARLRGAVAALLLLGGAVDLAAYYATVKKAPMAEVAARIADGWRPGDGILLDPEFAEQPLAYYLRRRGGVPLTAALGVDPAVPGTPPFDVFQAYPLAPPYGRPLRLIAVGDLDGAVARFRRVWVVAEDTAREDPAGQVMATLGRIGRVVERRAYPQRLELALVELAPGVK